MSWREGTLLAGALVCFIPALASFVRHRNDLVWGVTLFASASVASLLAVAAYLLHVGPAGGPTVWVTLLVALAVPVLVSGSLFSLILGREDAGAALRSQRRAVGALVAAGAVVLAFLGSDNFLAGYRWEGGTGRILLGPVGKAYLSYLLAGVVLVGYNLESTYRIASASVRDRLRLVMMGLFSVLGFFTYILTLGLLNATIDLDHVVAAVAPIGIASVLSGYAFLRGTLTDAAVPVSRNVVYSSFTAFVAGLYVLAVGVAAQVASFTRWSPGQVVTVAFVFLVLLGTVIFVVSNRFQRRVRRFVDRNFYVNRHDYRAQWFKATRSLDPSHGIDGVLRSASALLVEVFRADQVTIALLDRSAQSISIRIGKGVGRGTLVLDPQSPLARKLLEERRALLLNQRADDFEYIPIYVENKDWIEGTASNAVAPLLAGQDLLGVVGLERSRTADPLSYEDLALLECFSTQLAAVLRSVDLAEKLAEARESELLAQWSSMILHDLKNYLSPLRLIVQNMQIHMQNADFQKAAVEDLASVTARMERLVRRLSDLKGTVSVSDGPVHLGEILETTVRDLRLERHPGLTVTLRSHPDAVAQGDAMLLRRVVENLVTNAVEAMNGTGTLLLKTESPSAPGAVSLTVADTGPGMDARYVTERLFRPFATTKHGGLGLGLYQCHLIAEAHHGRIDVETSPGRGCKVTLVLRSAVERPEPAAAGLRERQA